MDVLGVVDMLGMVGVLDVLVLEGLECAVYLPSQYDLTQSLILSDVVLIYMQLY